MQDFIRSQRPRKPVALRGVIINCLLLTVSLIVSLTLAELYLRYGMSPERLVPNAPETPALNERRNALRFYAQQRERTSFSDHDRWLGWDAGNSSTRIRGKPELKPPAPGNVRAILLGDSFSWGNEVAEDENFAYLLDQEDNGLELLNMGVPGFGIDQMVLKFERYGAGLAPDLVILGIYVSDYERTTVAFTAAAKPLFHLVGDDLRVTNSPVPTPAIAVEQIAASLQGRLYLTEFIRNRLPGARQEPDQFFDASDELITALIRRLRNSLNDNQRLLILHIPRGESFIRSEPFHQEMSRRLLAIYQQLDLTVLNVTDVLSRTTTPDRVPAEFYRVRDSGSIGHLNPAGHLAVAEALGAEILVGDAAR